MLRTKIVNENCLINARNFLGEGGEGCTAKTSSCQ